ncbi:class IIb bacteriocin, lactobin A/cerein 7B family [Lysobacter sp. GCM10012299]|jgi:lactobin A/cerein 7B family class IIb bacteriocin|uniref:class IIb bacteriocin, lactobin A/cerein 7B family n=1 Tax=Lysobacter sp. GCM10012299 TaxID=3317333 RepID=UPI00361ACE3F
MRELNQNELENVGGGVILLGLAIATASFYGTLAKFQAYDYKAYAHNFHDSTGFALPRVPLFAGNNYYAQGWPAPKKYQ